MFKLKPWTVDEAITKECKYSRNNNITLFAKCWNCTEHRRKSIRIQYGIWSSQKLCYSGLTIKVDICMKCKNNKLIFYENEGEECNGTIE